MKYTLPRSCSLATMCYPLFGKYRVLLKEKTRASIDLRAEEATSPRQELTCQLIKTKVRNYHCVVNGRNLIIHLINNNFLRRQRTTEFSVSNTHTMKPCYNQSSIYLLHKVTTASGYLTYDNILTISSILNRSPAQRFLTRHFYLRKSRHTLKLNSLSQQLDDGLS